MKWTVFSLLGLTLIGCQNGANDMHFGPGPDEESASNSIEKSCECGKPHQKTGLEEYLDDRLKS